MEPSHEASAARVREGLRRQAVSPAQFRQALLAVPARERDAWVDRVLELDALPDDGPALPPDGVPYLPCAVDAVLQAVSLAGLTRDDVVADLGSGLGRALALLHWLSGAAVIGLEVQPHLVAQSRALLQRAGLSRHEVVEGDAALLAGSLTTASVFFLYCPFGDARLRRTLAALEALAKARPLRVVGVHLPQLSCAWLEEVASSPEVTVYRSR